MTTFLTLCSDLGVRGSDKEEEDVASDEKCDRCLINAANGVIDSIDISAMLLHFGARLGDSAHEKQERKFFEGQKQCLVEALMCKGIALAVLRFRVGKEATDSGELEASSLSVQKVCILLQILFFETLTFPYSL